MSTRVLQGTPLELLAQRPPPAYAVEVLCRLKESGHRAYLVGGCVRDPFLGRSAKDYDVATEARPEQVRALFRRVIPTGIAHGTVTVLQGKAQVEVTTFRAEAGYADARHPDSVTFLNRIEEDLARRDFTFNAMAYDPIEGAFIDPFGGVGDLRAGLVRCVGKALERFAEDGLRTLRAVRFATVLGFELERETAAAIGPALTSFSKVAKERIRDELLKMLVAERPGRGLKLLAEHRLLERTFPPLWGSGLAEGARPRRVELAARLLDLLPPVLEPRLAAMLHAALAHEGEPGAVTEGLELASRWEEALVPTVLPRRSTEQIALLAREARFAREPWPDDAALRRGVARVGRGSLENLFALGRALAWVEGARHGEEGSARAIAEVERLRERFEAALASNPPLTVGELALTGSDVMRALGCAGGPTVGAALKRLLEAVLETPTLNERERLLSLLMALPRDETVPQVDPIKRG